MYATHLSQHFISPSSVANYISGVRLLHKYISAPCKALDSFELTLTMRAIKLTVRHVPRRKLPITPLSLRKLCIACDSMDSTLGKILKVAVLFGYFGMLRQSNLAPRTPSKFDPTRHTCRGDILHKAPGLIMIVKWAKCAQSMDNVNLLPIPQVHACPTMDPCRAYAAMTQAVPAKSNNAPLLMLPNGRAMSVAYLRRCFTQLLLVAGLNPRYYSLHSLRRGAATAAYQAGLNFLEICRHGGAWRSNAFMDYIVMASASQSRVANALATSVEGQ